MLSLKKIIIHEIIKEINSNKVDKYFATAIIPLASNPQASTLIEKINKSYEEDEIVYSSFKKPTISNFPSEFEKFEKAKKTDQSFVDFSDTTLENLRLQLERVLPAKGGYYVYAEYNYDQEDFIGIFLIRDTEGILFKKTANQDGFLVDTINYMNTEKLAMACRINLTAYSSGQKHYLTLIKKNQEAISDYFYDWISTADKESNKEYTDALYNIISLLPLPLNKETKKKYTLDELRKDVLTYIIENNRDVDIRTIGKHFYGEAGVIVKYAKENSITIDRSFKADKKGLRKFKHLNVNSDGIKFQFSHGDYASKKVRFSPDNENIVIIESERFAKALKRELEEYKIDVKN